MKQSLVEQWYSQRPALFWVPLSWLFCLLVKIRRALYKARVLPSQKISAPVIVVGNISVGGTGKTPLVAWLVKLLRAADYTPGIVTRGYGGQAERWPQQVRPDSDPVFVGDEPVLLAQRCGCPVVAAPDRVAAAQALLKHSDCNVVITDDGLQHYRLRRDIELVVVDGARRFGNEYCLPAGPLREPISRLKEVDYIVSNGDAQRGEFAMKLAPSCFVSLQDANQTMALESLKGKTAHALAGIGNPSRFFTLLKSLGMEVIEHPFPDHHKFEISDLNFDDELPVLMTEKDAVKCRSLTDQTVGKQLWYLPVDAQLDDTFAYRLLQQLKNIQV